MSAPVELERSGYYHQNDWNQFSASSGRNRSTHYQSGVGCMATHAWVATKRQQRIVGWLAFVSVALAESLSQGRGSAIQLQQTAEYAMHSIWPKPLRHTHKQEKGREAGARHAPTALPTTHQLLQARPGSAGAATDPAAAKNAEEYRSKKKAEQRSRFVGSMQDLTRIRSTHSAVWSLYKPSEPGSS